MAARQQIGDRQKDLTAVVDRALGSGSGVCRRLATSHMKPEATCLRDFHDHILVRCPRCSACAHLRALPTETTHRGHRFVCSACAHSYEWNLAEDGCIPLPGAGPHLYGFGVDLWLTTPCCGQTLWAYNQTHLEFLEKFISARVRSQAKHPEHGWANGSLQSRLPRWMLARNNREAVLHGIEKLSKKLPSVA